MKLGHINKLLSAVLLATGSCGYAHADVTTTYTYTYSYNWTVPNDSTPPISPSSCSNNGWLSNCQLSGGTRTLSSSSSSDGSPVPGIDPDAPAASITSTASGWSDTGNPNDNVIQQGWVQSWGGGLGVASRDEGTGIGQPNHAMDNANDWEFLLYGFDSQIALNSVSISWHGNSNELDSDLIVLAYDESVGGAWNVNKLNGQTFTTMSAVNSGWKVIGNLTDLQTNTPTSFNGAGVSSSYWLIGAANNQIAGGTNDGNTDYVKVYSVGGIVTTSNTVHHDTGGSVPEPGSLLLLGLGSLMLVGARKKLA